MRVTKQTPVMSSEVNGNPLLATSSHLTHKDSQIAKAPYYLYWKFDDRISQEIVNRHLKLQPLLTVLKMKNHGVNLK